MNDTLIKLLNDYDNSMHATTHGTNVHKKMRFVNMLDANNEVVQQINSHPELSMFFVPHAQTEVPVAAIINGRFISRRIDRMVVDDKNHIVHIMDYKTDSDKTAFRSLYIAQVREYMAIVSRIYPKYKVYGYILWLHDWSLEKL